MNRYILTLAFISLLFTGNAQLKSTFNLLEEDQSLVEKTRSAYDIPALAAAVVTKDTILYLEVSGYRNNTSKEPVGKNDHFHLGSNTKAITAMVAAGMVEEGKLEWETRFLDMFPEMRPGAKKEYHQITLADLLSHRAGIQPFTDGKEFSKLPDFEGTSSEQRIAFAKYLLKKEPVKEPGKVNYSNAGYAMAAAMTEKAAGRSWETMISELLQDQLQLSYGTGWPNQMSEDQPCGHTQTMKAWNPHPPDHEYQLAEFIAPAGDIHMRVKDYARFISINLQGLHGENDLLNEDTWSFLHSGRDEYAMGWLNFEQNGVSISSHDGSAGTFYCHAIILNESDLGIIILANAATESTVKGIYDLQQKLIAKYLSR